MRKHKNDRVIGLTLMLIKINNTAAIKYYEE